MLLASESASCTDGTGKDSLSYLILYAKVIQWSTDLQLPILMDTYSMHLIQQGQHIMDSLISSHRAGAGPAPVKRALAVPRWQPTA